MISVFKLLPFLGVSSLTGEILYECSIHGCNNKTGSDRYVEQDVLIVQRFQQTVRAIEPRTGAERYTDKNS